MAQEIKNKYTISRIRDIMSEANEHYSGWVDEELDKLIEHERADMLELYRK